jgi:putative peptidoglycan lipid II flippase
MFKSIIVNFAGIFNSRILGFIRDLLSADILGANMYSDIFFVAFKFPNLFRRIFAEGAFTQSFIPSFTKTPYKPAFAWKIFISLLGIIILLSLLVNLFAYPITDFLAYGFSQEAKRLAAPLVAINFWYLDLIFIVTFFASLLQYKGHFATTAFSTALLNISIIAALLLSMHLSKEKIIFYMSWAVVIGGVAQVIAHLIAAKKFGILKMLYIGAKSRKKPETKTFKKHFLPSVFGNSTAHISAFLDTWLATFLAAGSVSYLYYANRLFQLPLALFAIASSTVLFPKITKLLKNDKIKEADFLMKKIFWILFYALSFAAIIGIVDSREFVKILFQHGAFNAKDTYFTSGVLIMYLLGLLPWGLTKIFSSYLYATHKHLKAAKFSAYSLGANILFSIALIFPLKVYGLALAGSISGLILFILNLKEYGFSKFFSFFEKKYVFLAIVVFIISFLFAFLIKYAINILF